MLRHVMMPCFHMFSTSSYSEEFGWFAGAVVSSFISDRVELSNTRNPAVCHTVCRCYVDAESNLGFLDCFSTF